MATSHAPRTVIDRLLDEVAWAKTCLIMAASTTPGSTERFAEIKKLCEAIVPARRAIDDVYKQHRLLPDIIRITLRTCELAIPQLEAGAVLRTEHKDA